MMEHIRTIEPSVGADPLFYEKLLQAHIMRASRPVRWDVPSPRQFEASPSTRSVLRVRGRGPGFLPSHTDTHCSPVLADVVTKLGY